MFYDDDFDGYDPTEPFSQAEFVVHSDRELRNLDAGGACGNYYHKPCVCGDTPIYRDGDDYATCPNCGREYA